MPDKRVSEGALLGIPEMLAKRFDASPQTRYVDAMFIQKNNIGSRVDYTAQILLCISVILIEIVFLFFIKINDIYII